MSDINYNQETINQFLAGCQTDESEDMHDPCEPLDNDPCSPLDDPCEPLNNDPCVPLNSDPCEPLDNAPCKPLDRNVLRGCPMMRKKQKKSEETKPSFDRWSIFRDKHMPYADAYPTMNSTLKTLADKLGLDMDDALGENGWLRNENGYSVSIFEKRKVYKVPNIVFIDFGLAAWYNYNPLGFIAGTDLYWTNYERARKEAMEYEKEDFKLVTSSDVSKADVENHLRTKGIYVYIFSGHGVDETPGALKTLNKEGILPGRYTPYKIQHMTLYACSSLKKNVSHAWAMKEPANKSLWNTNISSKGWVTGYIEDTNFLISDDIYKKTMYGNTDLTSYKGGNDYDYRKK
ncbi:MAG: hypothetical protein A2017_09930 [Lentisphaerae bacterium GWF2_44_16]|nr:MAG: hypothetical protein A2017_09930 [Lentisphaerae bacterium GWF2_44_16]